MASETLITFLMDAAPVDPAAPFRWPTADTILPAVLSDLSGHEDIVREFLHLGIAEALRDRRYAELRALKRREVAPAAVHQRDLRNARAREATARAMDAASSAAMDRLAAGLSTLQHGIEAYAQSVLAKWMIDGKIPLGEATKEDLTAAANREAASAAGHLRNVTFYRALAEHVPPGGRLRDHITPSEAETLRERVFVARTRVRPRVVA